MSLPEGQSLAPETPPAKKKAVPGQAPTAYLILTLDEIDHSGMWFDRGPVTARSAEQAVREYAKAAGLTEPVTLVAIPQRSFRPVTVRPTTVTSLVIEEAKP
jgi:hypothetical protein